jgi:hypothetical protein
MPYKYSPEQKAAVMVQLERNGGNVPLTSQQTAVPDRTLYHWQRQILPHLQQYTPLTPVSPPNSAETLAFDDDLSALAFIRQHIMDEMIRLSASLKHDPGISTPYQRVLVLSQLMDKLMKLDLHLRPYTTEDDNWDDWGFSETEERDEDFDDEDDDPEYDPRLANPDYYFPNGESEGRTS